MQLLINKSRLGNYTLRENPMVISFFKTQWKSSTFHELRCENNLSAFKLRCIKHENLVELQQKSQYLYASSNFFIHPVRLKILIENIKYLRHGSY